MREAEPRSNTMLRMLGPRPDSEAVEAAKQALIRIDTWLSTTLAKEISVEEEKKLREAAEKEKLPYLSVIQLDTLHQSYKEISELHEPNLTTESTDSAPGVKGEVSQTLEEAFAKKSKHLELSGRALKNVPTSLADMSFISSLNLSNNHLEVLPDTLGGFVNLETLNLQSNQLGSLPDAIGSLLQLKNLNLSGNLLKTLPESLGNCSKLVELNANFNQLKTWPANLGWKLINLRKLSLQLNSLMGLPGSVGELRSLKVFILHSNKLGSLPSTIGRLSELEVLDLSRNFNNLCTLPDSIGDLVALTNLDLSFNQIRELPASLGQLKNLKRLQLEQNPLVVPPKDVIKHSHEAVMAYLLDRFENGVKVKETGSGQSGRKLTPKPATRSAACLMIPMSPRHEHPGGWVPVRPGGRWMRSLLGQFMCGGMTNVMGGSTMRWQEHHSDDED